MTDPGLAGLSKELTVLSSLRMAPEPRPVLLRVKMAGEEGATGSDMALVCMGVFSWRIAAWVKSSSNGTIALIWLLPAYRTGAGMPSIWRDTLGKPLNPT